MSFTSDEVAIVAAATAVLGTVVPYLSNQVRKLVTRFTAIRRYQATLAPEEAARSQAQQESSARLQLETREEFTRPQVLESMTRPEPYFYVTRLLLSDVRCFTDAYLDLRFPGEESELALPNVNLLLGDNGTGKSTILRSIAMAALGPVLDSSGFVPYRIVREGKNKADIAGAFILGSREGPRPLYSGIKVTRHIDLEIIGSDAEEPDWQGLFSESSPSFFIVGYGTNRRISDDPRSDPSLERGRRRRRYQRVASLFEGNVSLVPLSSWLPLAASDRKADVEDLFSCLLPEGATFTGNFEGDEPVFRRKGIQVPLRALSDGFRSYISWLCDLLYQMNAAAPPGFRLQDVGGIALVDEVDLLLHPSWQRVVVPAVSRALPKIQFVFTTHSPIVTGTLQAGNIVVCREDDDNGVSTVERVDAEVYGLNSEQVLLSSYFEMNSTRAPGADETLDALAQRAVQGDEAATSEYLQALARGLPDPGREPDR